MPVPEPEPDPSATRPVGSDTAPMLTPLGASAGDTVVNRPPVLPPAAPPPPPPPVAPPPPAAPPGGPSLVMILAIFGLALVGIVLLGVGIFAVARLTAPTAVAGLTATATTIALPTQVVVIPTTTPQPSATNTPEPTATATEAPPTATATLGTPESTVTATDNATVLTIISGANVRGGPGTEYEVIGGIKEGDTVPVLGISAGGTWYAIDFGSAREGRAWVSAQVATFAGNDSDLPIIAAPPKPLPTATSKPVNNPAPGPIAGTHGEIGRAHV